jgi:amino acid permease
MKKLIPVVLIGVIVWYFLLNIDLFSSFVPGWHTTIYPRWVIMIFIVLLVLTFLGLLKLVKKSFWSNKK